MIKLGRLAKQCAGTEYTIAVVRSIQHSLEEHAQSSFWHHPKFGTLPLFALPCAPSGAYCSTTNALVMSTRLPWCGRFSIRLRSMLNPVPRLNPTSVEEASRATLASSEKPEACLDGIKFVQGLVPGGFVQL
jgi:hypothetical protein